MHTAVAPHRAAVDLDSGAVDVRTRAAGQVHDDAGDVLGPAEAARGVSCRVLGEAARHGEQAVGHLGGEEAGADGVDEDVAGAELDGEVAAEVDGGRLAGAVRVRALRAEGADAEPGRRRRDDDARRVVDRGPLLQEGGELLGAEEDGLDVEVHDLLEGGVRVRVEGGAPRRARVREEDVYVGGVLPDLRY